MKTIEEVLVFCKVFTFDDHHKNERVVELSHARHCDMKVLSKYDFISEDNVCRVLGVLVDISLMVINGKISLMVLKGNSENLVHEINKLRVGFLQFLCLENFYKQEAAKEDKKVLQ